MKGKVHRTGYEGQGEDYMYTRETLLLSEAYIQAVWPSLAFSAYR